MSRNGIFNAAGLKQYKDAITTDSNEWRVEIAIGFSDLGLIPGQENKSIAFAIFIRDNGQDIAHWPDNSDKDSPKTWGALSSRNSWGKVDLETQSLMAVPTAPITGENVTIAFMYTNKGNSPFSGVQIGFYVDNALIKMLNDTRVIEPSGSLIASAIWRATSGNHTISVKLDPLNIIYETNKDNNELSITIAAKLAMLTIKAEEGVNITVNGNVTRVGSSKEAIFYANLSEVRISAQKTNYFADNRYVFQRWKLDDVGSNNSTIMLLISGDMEIEAIYKAEYMVRMSFLDSKGHQISPPSTVRFIAPNGSSIVLRGGYDIWLSQGTMTITSINWSDVNVLPSDSNYNVVGPRTLSLNCKVFDVTVAVGDSLDLPVAGANVMLVLPNGTKASRVTGFDGKAIFLRIPTGRLSGTVSNLGIITTITGRELISDLTLNVTLALSFGTIVFMIIIVAAILVVLAFYWRRKAKRQESDKLLRSLGPPV